jgi:site-specific DNA-adenine methylase
LAGGAETALDQLEKRGEAITNNLKTPLELLRDRTDELNKLLESGAITSETYRRAIEKERKGLQDLTRQQSQAAQAASRIDIRDSIQAGSAEAFNVIFGRAGTDSQTELQQVNNQIERDQLRLLEQLLAAMEDTAENTEGSGQETTINVNQDVANW